MKAQTIKRIVSVVAMLMVLCIVFGIASMSVSAASWGSGSNRPGSGGSGYTSVNHNDIGTYRYFFH